MLGITFHLGDLAIFDVELESTPAMAAGAWGPSPHPEYLFTHQRVLQSVSLLPKYGMPRTSQVPCQLGSRVARDSRLLARAVQEF